jgi:hypothetical protein
MALRFLRQFAKKDHHIVNNFGHIWWLLSYGTVFSQTEFQPQLQRNCCLQRPLNLKGWFTRCNIKSVFSVHAHMNNKIFCLAAMLKRKICVKFLLASLKNENTTNSKDSSKASSVSVLLYFSCHWSIFSSVLYTSNRHSGIFRITGGSWNNF